ncbi:MAG TPA: tRNA (adenosine(37)-N6)-threonylcarbamoyltransferase complex dimerization subunit type 1 TsaB [bacterium]|nr:tRNA (adenosine(37)-N6)-threonylcarbamoyltransferase complex dimerization subunit type 1 TsaB [bacterium]
MALARDGIVLSEAVEQTGGRATNALGLIESALATAGLSRDEIEVIAVGLGPGSYTGIRAAIAVAQGWQLARGVKLLGISSVEAIAAQAQVKNILGTMNVVIDAQRGEFYLATWEVTGTALREISPLKIASQAEIEALRTGSGICVGPEAERVLFPTAALIAVRAAQRSNFLAGENLEPIYLRETTFVKATPVRH